MQGKWVLSVAGNMQIPHAAGQLSQQHSERSPHTPQWRLSAGKKKKKTRKNKNKTGLEQYRCMFLFYKKVRILLLVDDTFIITSQKLL